MQRVSSVKCRCNRQIVLVGAVCREAMTFVVFFFAGTGSNVVFVLMVGLL